MDRGEMKKRIIKKWFGLAERSPALLYIFWVEGGWGGF
jgi:hypothetical protein